MSMDAAHVLCPECDIPLPFELINAPRPLECPNCRSRVLSVVFPALMRPVAEGAAPERTMLDSEAACFYHEGRKAVVPCGTCGRFLCALCDIELAGAHICPSCLESGVEKGRMQKLETSRVRYDNIALALALLPVALVIFIWFTPLTAPMALYYVIRYWNAQGSLVQKSKPRFVIAGIFATLEIAGWVLFFVYKATV